MRLILENVVPQYISLRGDSDVWNHQVTITKGEHVHIVAASGRGKSSLIHYIYGLRNDYTGVIKFDGQEIKTMSPETKAEVRQKHFSIIFQDLRLFDNETALENIEIKRRLSPYRSEDEAKVMAQRLGIENKLSQKTKTCSYGEQQRICIIRALMQPFDFLLLDEPFSHLDEKNREKAMELIYEECAARNAAMLFADLKNLDLLSNEKSLHL